MVKISRSDLNKYKAENDDKYYTYQEKYLIYLIQEALKSGNDTTESIKKYVEQRLDYAEPKKIEKYIEKKRVIENYKYKRNVEILREKAIKAIREGKSKEEVQEMIKTSENFKEILSKKPSLMRFLQNVLDNWYNSYYKAAVAGLENARDDER